MDAVEIINKEKRWKIANRDSTGKFFVIEKATPSEEEHSVLRLREQLVSVREDQQLSMFLEKEVEYQIQERENLTKKIEEIQIECAEIREKDT